ncbi:MAG: sensor histidine kinase N-terminal domain-containing protein [Verrucomicrobia bacterium]|nr:sensor histidine kinase N-terminal domain-containing protein [Verrucomicrobiota bacterium]
MNSLRRQLTRTLLGAITVLLGTALVAMALLVRHALLGSFDAALQTKTLAVSSLVETEDGRVQFDFSDDFLRGFGAEGPRTYFEIWDAAGVVIARSPSLAKGDLPREALGREAPGPAWALNLPGGGRGRAVGIDFTVKPSNPAQPMIPAPRVQLVVATDSAETEATLLRLLATFAGCGALLIAAVWLVVPWALRRGLAPLDEFGSEVARLTADTLSAPVSVAGLPVELRSVAERLNELLARLAKSFERERRFSADLAHELRTPLAELRSLAECALKWPEARDPATDRDVLEIALQMEVLVSRMLQLARGEHQQLAAVLVPVDLPGLVSEVWRPLAARAEARGLRATFAVEPGTVSADAVLLRGILQNLFENAVAHAPAGTEIRVSGASAADGQGYVLRCANAAGDLTPEDVGQLFERFWRKESARSTGGRHLGLGLSLARMFALAMRWRLTAALTPDGWLEFTLETERPAVL